MIVWKDAKDKNVATKVFFGNTTDDKLYADAEFEVQAKEADVTDAFLKGALLVQVGTAICVATKVSGNEVTVDGDVYAAEAEA